MKIYTKKGDQGETSLFGGQRVPKSGCRIEAYGKVDELNSMIGLVRSYDISDYGDDLLNMVQHHLFILGADLATPESQNENKRIKRIRDDEIEALEEAIDELQVHLPPLKNFILPGGAQAGATLHIARTVCRRTERSCVRCREHQPVSESALKYLNRLSDFLFVIARYENQQQDVKEQVWKAD